MVNDIHSCRAIHVHKVHCELYFPVQVCISVCMRAVLLKLS